MKLRVYKNFVRFWLASAASTFGMFILTLSLQVLVLVYLDGSALDVGWVSAARWLPYVLLGLVAGVFIDAMNRETVLVVTDIGRGLILVLIGVLAVTDSISIGGLMAMLVLFGVMALFNDAADQSFLPQLVPKTMLVRANSRLEQVSAVGETTGPAIAGGLVSWIGAPFVILLNAFTYIFSGLLVSTIKSVPAKRPERSPVRHRIKEGLKWLYQHTYMKPLTLNTHFWFLWHSMTVTILVAYVISGLGFDESLLGLVLAAAGIGAVIGTSLSGRAAAKFGLGRAISVSRILYGPAVMLMVLAPSDTLLLSLVLVMSGQLIYGFAMGIEGPLEMGFQQTVTPDHLLGRVNATKRSINRSMIVIGAPLGGALADMIGFRPALWITIIGLLICGIWFLLSPMDKAELEEEK